MTDTASEVVQPCSCPNLRDRMRAELEALTLPPCPVHDVDTSPNRTPMALNDNAALVDRIRTALGADVTLNQG